MDKTKYEALMRIAMAEAELAIQEGNSPYGAVLVDNDGNIIAQGHNTAKSDCDPTAHAEINVLRKAAKKLGQVTFEGYGIVTNAESCSMCMSAAIKARVRTFYHGAPNGIAGMNMDPAIPASEVAKRSQQLITIISHILADECAEQIARAKKVTL